MNQRMLRIYTVLHTLFKIVCGKYEEKSKEADDVMKEKYKEISTGLRLVFKFLVGSEVEEILKDVTNTQTLSHKEVL